MAKWHQDWYIIKNPQKYIGNKEKVFFKSNLENRVMFYLDNNSNIIRWSYEQNPIPYLRPMFESGKLHHIEERNYFLDFYCEVKERDGSINKYLLEIKSKSETLPPIRPKKMSSKAYQRYQNACQTYAINMNKWKSAKKYCDDKGWKFKIITDDLIN